MFVRIMIFFLFICSIYQDSFSQQHRNLNLNYSIQGVCGLGHYLIEIFDNIYNIYNI